MYLCENYFMTAEEVRIRVIALNEIQKQEKLELELRNEKIKSLHGKIITELNEIDFLIENALRNNKGYITAFELSPYIKDKLIADDFEVIFDSECDCFIISWKQNCLL